MILYKRTCTSIKLFVSFKNISVISWGSVLLVDRGNQSTWRKQPWCKTAKSQSSTFSKYILYQVVIYNTLNKLPLNDHINKTFNYEFHTHTPKSSNRTLATLNTVFWLVVFRVSAQKLYSRFVTTRPDVHLSHVFVKLRNCWGRHVYLETIHLVTHLRKFHIPIRDLEQLTSMGMWAKHT